MIGKRILPPVLIASIFAGAGFATAALLARERGYFRQSNEISADCAIYAADSIRGNAIRIKCGLDPNGIEAVLQTALEELGFDDVRREGDLDLELASKLAERLNLTNEAVMALLEPRQNSQQNEGAAARDQRGIAVPTAVSVVIGEPERSGSASLAAETPRFEEMAIVTEPSEAAKEVTGKVGVHCAAHADTIEVVEEIELECGPEPDDIEALVDHFVETSGAADIKQALAGDAQARQEFVRALADYYHLEDETVATLVAGLEQGEGFGEDAADRIDSVLRVQMRRALLLLRMGRAADRLHVEQAEVAEAIVAGKDDAAAELLQKAGESLRPLVNDLAPPALSRNETVAALVDEAAAASEAGDLQAAADLLYGAAQEVAADMPLVADAYRLAAVNAIERSDLSPDDYLAAASDLRIAAARRLNEASFEAAMAAAAAMRERGDDLVDGTLLQRSVDVVNSVARTVDAEDDPERYYRVQTELATLKWRLGVRRNSLDAQLDAERAAEAALRVTEQLGVRGWDALNVWGNVQLELARLMSEPERLGEALGAYERLAREADSADDQGTWATATANIALVNELRAREAGDALLLAEAAAAYRDLLAELDRHDDEDAWAYNKNRLASVLYTRGVWEGSGAAVREAIREIDAVKALHAEDGAVLPWAEAAQAEALMWGALGRMEQQPNHFETAAELMAKAAEVYDTGETLWAWINLEEARAHLLAGAAELSSSAAGYLDAAEAISGARNKVGEQEHPVVFAEYAIREARYRMAAVERGAGREERVHAIELAEQAMALAEARAVDGGAEWEKISGDGRRLLANAANSTE